MIKIKNFVDENDDITIIDEKGPFKIIEYDKNLLDVTSEKQFINNLLNMINIKPRQLIIDLNKTSGINLKYGIIQQIKSSNKITSMIKSHLDIKKSFLELKSTNNSSVKAEYQNDQFIVSKQTYNHLILLNLSDWNNKLMMGDKFFFASEKSAMLSIRTRINHSQELLSSDSSIYNILLSGNGIVCIESKIPFKDLITIELKNDSIMIDASNVIAWTDTIKLSVEKLGKEVVGPLVSDEKYINVFKGSGKILIMP